MDRIALVFYNDIQAGRLIQSDNGYVFEYEESYLQRSSLPAISLSLPKRNKEFRSKDLFPFFYGLLSEGENKDIQCRMMKIDESDHFTRLIKTAHTNTIGAVTVRESA